MRERQYSRMVQRMDALLLNERYFTYHVACLFSGVVFQEMAHEQPHRMKGLLKAAVVASQRSPFLFFSFFIGC